ncbi:MAG: hypothetical protein Q9174_005554 [Haloplaca sp. 1 TL-2023]
MLSTREDGGVTGTILHDPVQYTVLSACTAVAWIFCVELILNATLAVDRRRATFYYYSLIISSCGCIVHALGFVLKFLVGTSWLVDLTFIGIGWIAMVSGQSFVLWSRLNLVVRSKRILKGVLAGIIINGLILHTVTLVFIYGANSPSAGHWVGKFNIVERVQLIGFSLQESAIGGIYIVATGRLLGAIYYAGTRKAMVQLLAINCICLGMDIILIALEFSSYYVAEASVKPLIYALKLKLEFAVYSQLVGFTKQAFEDGEAIESINMKGESRSDFASQRRRQYSSPAEFLRNIPSVLRKPPAIAPYPTLHTHPEQLMKSDRAFGKHKTDRPLSGLRFELSASNAAAAFTATGGGGGSVLPRIAELLDYDGSTIGQRSRNHGDASTSEDSFTQIEGGPAVKHNHVL